MRHIIPALALLLFAAFPTHGYMGALVCGSSNATGGGSECSCTDADTFCWDVENGLNACDGTNYVLGTEGGSQSGQTTTDPVHGGTYAWDTVDDVSFVSFAVTSDDLISGSEGSLELWVNVQTQNNYDAFWSYYVDDNNYMLLDLYDQDARSVLKFGGTTNYLTATDLDELSGGSFVKLTLTWQSGGAGYLYVSDVQRASDLSLGTWSGTSGTMRFGANQAGVAGCDFILDDVRIDATQ